jgi:hypothetical protein
MATHRRDSLIAFDLYPTQETAPRGKHDGSIIGTVRDRSNHEATETNRPGWIDRWRRQLRFAGGNRFGESLPASTSPLLNSPRATPD